MIDLGISKLAIIGVVALVVIGPEKLPRVARTMGTLFGRAQRYIAEVKAEVSREIQLDELRSMRDTVRDAAANVQSTVMREFNKTGSEIDATLRSAFDPMASASGVAGPFAESSATNTVMTTASTVVVAPLMSRSKRRSWRRNVLARQHATPVWYKHIHRKRSRVLSAAARVSRYRVRSS